jgi:hypothetical protein
MRKGIRRNNHIAPLGIFFFKRVKYSLCVSVAQIENAKIVLAAIKWKGEMMNFVSMFLESIFDWC